MESTSQLWAPWIHAVQELSWYSQLPRSYWSTYKRCAATLPQTQLLCGASSACSACWHSQRTGPMRLQLQVVLQPWQAQQQLLIMVQTSTGM